MEYYSITPMKVIQEKNDRVILRFEKGERFPDVFEQWARKRAMGGAFFYGIGGATRIRSGYYQLSKKTYIFKEFTGDHLEILHIAGNVAMLGDHLKIHTHLTFANEHFQAFGGHLDWLEVGGTLELKVEIGDPLTRKEDREIGLALLEITT